MAEHPDHDEPAMLGRRVRRFCDRNWKLCALASLVLAGVSVTFLLVAVGKRSLPEALAYAALGGVLGAGALLLANELWVKLMVTGGRLTLGLQIGAGLVVAGAAVTGVGLWLVAGSLAAAGLVVVLVGLLAVNLWLGQGAVACPLCWVVTGVALTIGGPLLLVGGGPGRGQVGIVLWLVGLTAFKLGMLPLLDQVTPERGRLLSVDEVERVRSRRAWWTVAIGTLVAAVGIGAAWYGADAWRPMVMAFGWLALLTGLSAAGMAATRVSGRRAVWIVVAVAGAAAIAGGAWMVLGVVGDWVSLILVVCGVLAALGAWFVFRGEGLVFLVLLGFVLAWALHDRSGGEITPVETGTPGVLALGDSFISGEGASRFLAGTNTKQDDGNTCRRAATAYPVLAAQAQDPPMAVSALACSGAVAAEITTVAQKENDGSDVAGWLPQLDSLTSTDPVFVEPDDLDAVEVVLVSIGGNDAEFGTIVKSCLLPTNCAEDREAWFAKAESIEDDLVDTYEAIVDAVPDTADVVVVPYAEFIDPEGCDRVISDDEVRFVTELIDVLNGTVQRAAREAGVLVADSAGTFEGHQHCDDEPGANLIVLAPEDGTVVERLNPATWVHNSMHPWELGHELQAEVLTPLVAALVAGDDPEEWLVDLDEVATDPQIPLDERDDLLATLPSEDDPQWVQGELYDTGAKIVWPIGLLLAGGLLVALGLARGGVGIAEFLAPDRPNAPHVARGDRRLHLFSMASTHDRATLLAVAASIEAPPEAVVRDRDGEERCRFATWRSYTGGRHPFWWSKSEVADLAPGSSVALVASADGFDDSPPAVVTTTPPTGTTSVSMVVGSCFDRANESAPAHLVTAYDRLVPETAGRPGETDHPLHFWLGDQVYVDAPWSAGLRAADAWDTVAGKYLDAWEVGPSAACAPERDPQLRFGSLLRRSSNWFLPDDHELWNGYPELSYVTLTHHALKRAFGQAYRKVFRRDSNPHPAAQGMFGQAAGEGFAIFQSPVDFDRFDEGVSPPQVQELDLDAVRVLVADTRWARTIRRRLPGSGFMVAEDLDHLVARLDTDKLVVLMLARPMLGNPPMGEKRLAIDVGAEYYGEQYTTLCRALYARTRAGRPTLLIGGDVHYHALRRAVDGKLLEMVCSPMSLLGGESGATLAGLVSGARNLLSSILPGRRAPEACFPLFDDDGDEIRPRRAGVTDLHLSEELGFRSALVRVDLDLHDPDRPAITYRCAQVGGDGFEARGYTWATAAGWQPSPADTIPAPPRSTAAPPDPTDVDVDDHLITDP